MSVFRCREAGKKSKPDVPDKNLVVILAPGLSEVKKALSN